MLTQERVRYLFNYDKETGVFTRLVTVMGYGAQKGKVAGYKDKTTGYLTIRVDGRLYLAHRLAYLYVEGYMPEEVDHRDLDRANNKWSNLRAATHTGNMRNHPMHKNNQFGLKGVSRVQKSSRVRATIVVNRRQIHLGTFDCPAAAHFAYLVASDQLHGEFARAG